MRPMTAEDVPAAAALADAALGDLVRRHGTGFGGSTTPFPGRWQRLLATDPGGLWVAEDHEGLLGVTAALRRGPVWGLSMLAVRVGAQARGIGGALLRHALRTAEGATYGMIVSSTDARAMRLYARAGFTLRPTLTGLGTPRAHLPGGTRLGGAQDLDLTEEVDRRVRGAARGDDLATLFDAGGRLVVVDGPPRGYALLRDTDVFTLAADDEPTAQRVLSAALAEAGGHCRVRWLDAAQQWALPVLLDAGLSLAPSGPFCVRGTPAPLTPYLPSGAFL
jgi:ribosomal protein S18 acetylase RimI-like enzyme